ncbi:CHAD domain-containing protein [Dyella acidiphila]|uniref:CHAD domain-containing protein n=1 Tax=Dyella acidiphila TaxID=2775866 RepID=A0ABR9GAJ6_9GAMM|nr:CHAD domain-containing protein [Dyella acidiphila]MBE1161057.1 CHAD domain-containing protein [Dyella acidiphila]
MNHAKHSRHHLGLALGSLAAKECHALQAVLASSKNPHDLIHEARRCGRKLRSLLTALPPSPQVARIDQQLKQLIHGFSPLRDAQIVIRTAQRLASAHNLQITPALGEQLQQRSTALLEDAVKQDPGWMKRQDQAERIGQTINTLPWSSITPAMTKAMLRRSSKRVKKARRKALEQRTNEAFHRSRRRARWLRYQLEFLRKAGHDAGMKKKRIQRYGMRIKRLRSIIDRLGWRQDYQVFLQAIDQLPATDEVVQLRHALARTSATRTRRASPRIEPPAAQ